MFKPKFNRIFWFVFVCLCSLLLNCSTFNCAKVQNEQSRGHCMVKCFHSGVETFRRAIGDKMSTRQSCFEECMRTFGSRSSFGNHDTKHIFTRLKRESENEKYNTTGDCNITELRGSKAIKKRYIKATFYKKTVNIFANVSWSGAPESANVTGYKLAYSTDANRPSLEYRCQDLNKINTFGKANLSSLELKETEVVRFEVFPLPLMKSDKIPESLKKRIPYMPDPTVSPDTTSSTALSPDTTSSTALSPDTTSSTALSVSQNMTSPTAHRSDKISSTLVIIAVCVALISAIALVLGCRYLRYLRLSRSHKQDLRFEFDAFIIYNSADEEWVNKTLRRTLEDKYGLRCCLHYRDFIPGKPFRENMADSVYKSKKTIAVVSHNFFRSKYCSHEMDMALGCSLQRGDNSVIVIKLDNVDENKLPKALKDRSFIDYGKLIERETWEKKLIDSMRPPSKQKTAEACFV